MPISQDEELRRFKQLQRLNYFYATTVMIMTVVLLLLLFNINAEQRRLIDETDQLIEQRTQEAEEQDRRAEVRLERALDRLEEVEALLEKRLHPDRFEILENNVIERLDQLINETKQ